MKLFSESDGYKLYEGSMLDMLEFVDRESIDSIVTDPPYELGFMGKSWDSSGIAFQPDAWRKCYQVLKPGGHLLAFGGSRTFHRIACAIEDAGFEIRDTIMWIYGCLSEDTEILTPDGFKLYADIRPDEYIRVYNLDKQCFSWETPSNWSVYRVEDEVCYHIKSDNTDQLVSKNHRCIILNDYRYKFEFAENLTQYVFVPYVVDCETGIVRDTFAEVSPEKYTGIIFCPTVSTGCFVARRNGKVFITGNSGFPKSMNIGLAIDRKNGVESEVVGSKGTMPDFVDAGKKNSVNKIGINDGESAERAEYLQYKARNEWDGFGTCLKPAYESIIVARKPCKGTCIDNVLMYGVGGINIDACRVPTEETITNHSRSSESSVSKGIYGDSSEQETHQTSGQALGRFPANVILTYDESDFDEVCGGFPVTKSTGGSGEASATGGLGNNVYGKYKHDVVASHLGGLGDSGSAARYFYCAKASKRDRDEGLDAFETKQCTGGGGGIGDYIEDVNSCSGKFGSEKAPHKNIHPAVKPTSLIQYLVRLVTPKGGTVLDPFNGSGSTGKACMYENKDRNAGYKYIGIDLSEEYLKISDARIRYALGSDVSPAEYTACLSKTQATPTTPKKKNPTTHRFF